MDESKKIQIEYTNWRGERGIRTIIPKEIQYISNEWHKEAQWCLIAYDIDKQAERTFACKDIHNWSCK